VREGGVGVVQSLDVGGAQMAVLAGVIGGG
jgi:hypothetical protein